MNITRRQFAGLTLASASSLAISVTPSYAGSSRSGTLRGRKGYTAGGTIQVKTANGKTKVILKSNYVFDPENKNPPDIKIGFGNNEKYAKGTKIHNKLTVKKGAAEFVVPASIDTSKYNQLYIYCERFSVILGVVALK